MSLKDFFVGYAVKFQDEEGNEYDFDTLPAGIVVFFWRMVGWVQTHVLWTVEDAFWGIVKWLGS